MKGVQVMIMVEEKVRETPKEKEKAKEKEIDPVTQEFNEQHKKLVEDGDVERIDETKPKSEYEKKTKRWFGEKNRKLY